jgi:hypothetical protein
MTHLWYQEIIVQLSSTCTAGSGNFVVTTVGGTSNGIPFTVRSGNIYCLSTTGNDSNSGRFPNSCWATAKNAFGHMSPGDTTYWEGGVTVTAGGSYSALDWGASGSAGNPVAMVSYPGATPQPGVNCVGCSSGIGIRAAVGYPSNSQYLTLAGLSIIGSGQAWYSEYTNPNANQRFVGNYFSCSSGSGQIGCIELGQTNFTKMLGNEVANIIVPSTSKQYHGVYFTTDANHIEFGWNSVHNNQSCRAIQVHSSPLDSTSGYNQFDLSIHDNLIHDDPCDGLLFATVDPSKGRIEAYNNIIYHVGLGPDPSDGEASYSCIRFAQYTNNGAAGTGTAEVYNNTLVDCGSHVGTFGLSGSYVLQSGTVGVKARNNIAYQNSGEFYTNSGSAVSGLTLTGSSNNIWFGSSQAAPSWSTNNISADPLFVNRSGNDFHIQSGSPAVDAGLIISSANSYNGYPVWNGTPMDRDGVTRPQGVRSRNRTLPQI